MKYLLFAFLLLSAWPATAQYTRQDTLRGSNGRGRDWWDVLKYDLRIGIDTAAKSISGTNIITFRISGQPGDSLQIDLQEGMQLNAAFTNSGNYTINREGNVYWLKDSAGFGRIGDTVMLELLFHGKPREAVNPPWDGGVIWTRDSMGRPWIAVACQGQGASSWWPCKDYQGDEPDGGMTISLSVTRRNVSNDNLDPTFTIVLNGRQPKGILIPLPARGQFIDQRTGERYRQNIVPFDQEISAESTVRNPINTYNATFYIGDYAHWRDTFQGEKGVLDLDFYPLKYNLAKAKKQWSVTKDMLRCFEYWLGPYPFYEDGYKLVDAPYLGMEHQSAVAYGNEYKMGYRGHDISHSGVGMSFDFIVIHESGHEWFGNSITAQDVADNWLHEGFTSYTEVLFAEWIKGRNAAFRYARGQWQNSQHRVPVIGDYGVNNQSSSDIYYKGSAVVHMIRVMMHDDQKFRALLRKLNRDFYHRIVTSRQVEDSIIAFTGLDLQPFFEQYLRRAELPTVYASQQGGKMTLSMRGYDERFRLPIYDQKGRFICELSRKPVTISTQDLPALQNYHVIYEPEHSRTKKPDGE